MSNEEVSQQAPVASGVAQGPGRGVTVSGSIFDSGFRMARLLRQRWFREQLADAGWVNGGSVMGVRPETTAKEMVETLSHHEAGHTVTVVMSEWRDNSAGDVYPMQKFDFFQITKR